MTGSHLERVQARVPKRKGASPLARPKRLLFAGIVVLGLAGAAEGLARAVDAWTHVSVGELRRVYQERRNWRLGKSWPVQRGDYPYLPYVPNPDHPDVNELGFRGAPVARVKPPDTYRIFCLGGSTTWNGYPEHLEAALREDFARSGLTLEVVNAGNQCWSSLESLISFITRCLPLEPDAIVVYHAVNDAVFAFAEDPSPDYTHLRKRFERDGPLLWDRLPAFLDHSAAYVGFRAIFERNVGTRGIPVTITRDIKPEDSRPYRGMEPFRQNLYTLVSIARARHIQVFLCTQIFNREYAFRAWIHRRWGEGVDDANAIIRSFGGRWDDVHVLDAAAAMPGSNEWMTDYCHFTEEGKSTFAAFMADRMRPHVLSLAARRNSGGVLPQTLARTVVSASPDTPASSTD
jgi:hypothetical protein